MVLGRKRLAVVALLLDLYLHCILFYKRTATAPRYIRPLFKPNMQTRLQHPFVDSRRGTLPIPPDPSQSMRTYPSIHPLCTTKKAGVPSRAPSPTSEVSNR